MKTMTCKQLGGACDLTFTAETFEEMARLSEAHGKQMFAQHDEAHLGAMQSIQKLMKEPGAMQAWFKARQDEFDALPDDPS